MLEHRNVDLLAEIGDHVQPLVVELLKLLVAQPLEGHERLVREVCAHGLVRLVEVQDDPDHLAPLHSAL
eukprot:13683826-Alexandrium_andersonii.AAC.1